ncbi:WD40/YVTN/BNR-like repeat-containing protein [Anaerosporobacter sp.]
MIYKRFRAVLVVSFIFLMLFTGCTNKEQSGKESIKTDSVGTDSSEPDSTSLIGEEESTPAPSDELLGLSPIGIKFYSGDTHKGDADIVFINSDTGWDALYDVGDTHQQNVTLYKTIDGGLHWDKITSTYDKNYTIPLEAKTGITFLDANYGWITTMTPQEGYIGVFRTVDGGYNWEKQEIAVPTEYSTDLFCTQPPTFFSEDQGVLLIEHSDDSVRILDPLVFITTDKGDTWIQLDKDSDEQNIKWTYSEDANGDIMWSVTYNNQLWKSNDGMMWEISD